MFSLFGGRGKANVRLHCPLSLVQDLLPFGVIEAKDL